LMDRSSPAQAQLVRQVKTAREADAVVAEGGIAIVSAGNELISIDLETGLELGRLNIGEQVHDLQFAGLNLVVLGQKTLHAVSFNSGKMTETAATPHAGTPLFSHSRLFVSEGLAYGANRQGFNVFDLTNPTTPTFLQTF